MDTTALAPMTELEAINDMLSLISESPVASLDEAGDVADAQTAMQLLGRESRTTQVKGWDWNTDEAYRLAPNIDGEIVLPTNTVKCDPTDISIDYVMRNGKLWDRTNKTFNIGKAVTVDITYILPFEELPESARRYISMSAGRKFENRIMGADASHQINETDVISAWADLLQEECDTADLNVIRNSTTVRNISHGRWRR
jgi:hypothetical protein